MLARLTAIAVVVAVAGEARAAPVGPPPSIPDPVDPYPQSEPETPLDPGPAPDRGPQPLGEPVAIEPDGAPAMLDATTDAAVEDSSVEELPDIGAEFGPVLRLESIEIRGNRTTQDGVIRRALPVRIGETMRAADPRLLGARYKVLALGFFRDVQLAMRRGSARGQVVLVVTVVERGTIVLNRLWFGASNSSVFWLGADLDERNLFGTGLSVGAGAVYAGAGSIANSRDQWAAELRLADPWVGTTRWGLYGSFTAMHGSEPYRISGSATESGPRHFRAFDYRRLGGRLTATYAVSALSRLSASARMEAIDADLPAEPTRLLDDGREVTVDLGLRPGRSRVFTLSFGFDRDTRPDPVLPHEGRRVALSAELGSRLLGGSYDFTSLLARFEQWWPVAGGDQAVGLRLAGGIVLGRAPRFDRIHVSDVNRLTTPRALGLVVATKEPLDILGTDNEGTIYGDVGGSATVEYAVRLFRHRFHTYGGDLFIAAGVWGLAATDELQARDRSLWNALPIDLVADAGLRIDTELGVFEFTFANALGRVPL